MIANRIIACQLRRAAACVVTTRSLVLQGSRSISSASSSSSSPWANYEMAPPDPIIGLNEAFQKDEFPGKVIVGVGAYRDDNGKPYVLPCVREAERRLMEQNLDMEYSGIVRSSAREKHNVVIGERTRPF